MQIHGSAHQSKPEQQILLRADNSVTYNLLHRIGGIAWVDEKGWQICYWMVLWAASVIKTSIKGTGSAYRRADTTNHTYLAKTGVVTLWDKILVHRIDASG
jgi:hypothetical protein